MTRARELARLANENVFTAEDYNSPVQVGINSTDPTSTLDVRGELKVGTAIQAGTAGVVTATEFSGSIGTFSGAGSFGGNLDVTGNVTIGGTLTYEDVTNIDVIGIVTAQNGVNISGGQLLVGSGVTIGNAGVATFSGTSDIHLLDSVEFKAGDGSDFKIVHNSSLSPDTTQVITASSQRLQIQTDSLRIVDSGSARDLIQADDGGAAALFFNGSNKFITTKDGTVTTGISTVTGDVSIADKIIHTGDTNTAIRFPAADTITAETGGSERLRIKSNGYVGIGTNNPAYFVSIRDAAPYIRIEDTAAPVNEKTWDFNAGTDGILRFRNTNDAANSSNNWLEVERDGVDTSSIRLLTGTGSERLRIGSNGLVTINASTYDALTINTTENGTNGPQLQLTHISASPAASDTVGQLRMSGRDSAGNTDLMSKIETIIDDPTSGQETAYLNFGTRGLASFNPILRLKNRGTGSAPSYTTDDHNGIILDVYNAGNPYPRYMNIIAKSAGDTDSNISFWTEKVGGSPIDRVRITADGDLNVGAFGGYDNITGTGGGLLIGPGTSKDSGIMLRSASDGFGRIYFGDNSGSAPQRHDGYIVYSQTDRNFVVGTATTTRLQLSSAGNAALSSSAPYTHSSDKHLEIGDAGANKLVLQSGSNVGALFNKNVVYDGSAYKYVGTGEAGKMQWLNDAGLSITNAVSGSAGNTVTFNKGDIYFENKGATGHITNFRDLTSGNAGIGVTVRLAPSVNWNTRFCEIYAENTGNNLQDLHFKTCAADTPEKALTLHRKDTTLGSTYATIGNQNGDAFCRILPISTSVAASSTKTVTISGLSGGTFQIAMGGYSNAGQSSWHGHWTVGGFMTGTNMYNVNELANWIAGGSISVTKNASNFQIAVTNNSGSYTLQMKGYAIAGSGAAIAIAYS